MAMFTGSQKLIITGGNFLSVGTNERAGVGALRSQISTRALLNSTERYDAPKCHEGTREAIIQDLLQWVRSSGDGKPFLWMFGAAGAGKSAISHSFAELCLKLGIIVATFFFSRVGRGESSSDKLISTLAYQLMLAIPGLGQHICESIERDTTIFSQNLGSQMNTLILQPLAKLALMQNYSDPGQASLIIIDGLDECEGREKQAYILSTLSNSFSHLRYPLRFFIASRQECDIKDAFNSQPLSSLSCRFALDVDYRADDDIQAYLLHNFGEIIKTHPMAPYIPRDWPSTSAVNHIIQKSSGQFVYAATVVRFVQDLRGSPTDRLKIILALKPAGKHTPFAELDILYSCIFDSVDQSYISNIHDILAYMFFLRNPFVFSSLARYKPKWRHRAPDSMEKFWGYEDGFLQILLADLQSLIYLPAPEDKEADLRLLHASLEDYLLDASRSQKFHLDRCEALANLARRCFQIVEDYNVHDSTITTYESLLKSPRVALPFLVLHELCQDAYPLSLDILKKWDSSTFGKYIRYLDQIDLHGMPENIIRLHYDFGEFIRWTQENCPDVLHTEACLCNQFMSGVDIFLRSSLDFAYNSLEDDISREKMDLVLTAISLPPSSFRKFYFPNFVNQHVDKGIQLPISTRASHGYNYSFLGSFVTDASRSGIYYRNESHYFRLAGSMLPFLTLKRTHNRDEHDTFEDDEEAREIIEYAIDAILAIMLRFPGDMRISDILRPNTSDLFKIEGGRWASRIKEYLLRIN